MAYENQRGWNMPPRNEPRAMYITPTANQRSDRAYAGPLRLSTSPGVGPRGALFRDGFGSDLGTDRTSPRGFDPMGTSDERAPRQEASGTINSEIRGRR
jgi:hypothetical protein